LEELDEPGLGVQREQERVGAGKLRQVCALDLARVIEDPADGREDGIRYQVPVATGASALLQGSSYGVGDGRVLGAVGVVQEAGELEALALECQLERAQGGVRSGSSRRVIEVRAGVLGEPCVEAAQDVEPQGLVSAILFLDATAGFVREAELVLLPVPPDLAAVWVPLVRQSFEPFPDPVVNHSPDSGDL
jgi:hypothetical protein